MDCVILFTILISIFQIGNCLNSVDKSALKVSKESRLTQNSTGSAPRCGGIIKDANVTINYKLFEPIVPNERCVWVIATPTASWYEIVVDFGFDPELRPLTIMAATKGIYSWSVNHPTASGEMMDRRADVLIVTFRSEANVTGLSGFSLRSWASITGSTDVNINSRYEIYEPQETEDFFLVSHPEPPLSTYLENELSMLFFIPPENIYDGQRRHLIFKEVGMEESCADFVTLYEFYGPLSSWVNNGRYFGRICSGERKPITSTDIILMTFNSDGTNHYGGFHLASVNLQCGQL